MNTKRSKWINIICAVLVLCMFASCGTDTAGPTPEGSGTASAPGDSGNIGVNGDDNQPSETQTPEEPTQPTETQSPAEGESQPEQTVSFVPGTSFSGQKRPVVVSDKQYLPETSVDKKRKGKIVYSVNDADAGYIHGIAVQDAGSATQSVRAIANLGYKFVKWSDGVTSATRSGDSEEGVYTAIFDYEVLDMPIVVINTNNGQPITSKTEYTGGTISLLGCEETYELQDADLQIRGRGNNSWTYPKKSYKLKLTEKANLLNLGNGKERVWVLLANQCDQSLQRNHVALELGRYFQGIHWEPASTSVEVYFNGEYDGVYLLAEDIRVSGDRVDVEDVNIDQVDTGYLLELSHYASDEVIQTANRSYEIHSDLSEDHKIRQQQRKFISDYVDDCYDALASGDQETFQKLVDIDSFLAAYLVEEITKNLDSQWDSFYLYKDAGGKLFFGPVWDFDLSLGNANEGAEEYTDIFVGKGRGSGGGAGTWFALAMRRKWFRQLVAEKWQEIYDSVVQMPQFILDEGQLGLASYKRNFKRWKIFGTVQNRETEYITSLRNYEEHYTYLAEWLTNRIEWLNAIFTGETFVSKGVW